MEHGIILTYVCHYLLIPNDIQSGLVQDVKVRELVFFSFYELSTDDCQ